MEPFIGVVMPFAFNFAPSGWAGCTGATMSIAQNTALFSLLGTMYGGDGMQTFNVPDLRGRVIIGQGQGPGLSRYSVGQSGGSENKTLSQQTMTAHTHAVSIGAASLTANTSDPANNYFGGGGQVIYTTDAPDTTLNPLSAVTTPVGNNLPFSVINPYLAMTYCIATEGIYPSRPQ